MIRRSRIELIETGQGNPFWAAMLVFKMRASQTINQILAEPHASLLNGILLGIETGIPRDLYESFNLIGTSHIIVISGSNISLIAGILLLLGVRLAATVLKSPHHGSRTSSSQGFLEAVDPQLVVISVGAENSFGHPSPAVIERYAAHGLPVLRTDERGTIELITDGNQMWVTTAR